MFVIERIKFYAIAYSIYFPLFLIPKMIIITPKDFILTSIRIAK